MDDADHADDADPALFFTGLAAEFHRAPGPEGAPDPEPFARFIAKSGLPALELACGAGDTLLALRARGLDVEGLDSSPDMLSICRARAHERSLTVTLHQAGMEWMELRRRYRSIYVGGPAFNLLVDDDTAWRALARMRAHLEPEGSALIPVSVPPPTPIGVTREVVLDGAKLRVIALSEHRDETARLQTTVLRYEREAVDGRITTEDRSRRRHWHTQEGFRQLAGDAGLLVGDVLGPEGRPARPDEERCTFWVGPDPAFDSRASMRDRLPPVGQVLAAGMLGLDQAIYGERPKVEIVAEADADGLDLGDIELDLDNPASSRLTLEDDG